MLVFTILYGFLLTKTSLYSNIKVRKILFLFYKSVFYRKLCAF